MARPDRLLRVIKEDGGVKWANLVTLSRIVLVIPITALLLQGLQTPALGLYVLAALTDAFDGWLARSSGRASRYGAQLDATVDNLFSLAILMFLLLTYPGLAARQGLALAVLFGAPLLYLVVSWALRRRLMMFHFWSAKVGGFLLFCLWPMIAFTGAEGLIALVAAVVGFSRIEQIVFLIRGGEDLNAPHGWADVAASAPAAGAP
ncbi:MAG: CDP-alcohol phosphatidyltransferase family protein [Caulobacter sp.]|nr:CDP-alcohol phosphatidyltransferase family protein [Caulobacter sp.]